MAFLPAIPFAISEGAALLGGAGQFITSVLAFQGAADLLDASIEGGKWVYDQLVGGEKGVENMREVPGVPTKEEIEAIINKNRLHAAGGGAGYEYGNTHKRLQLPKK